MSGAHLVVRQATQADTADILRFMRGLSDFHHELAPEMYVPGSKRTGDRERLGDWLTREDGVLLVVECDGRTSGYISAEVQTTRMKTYPATVYIVDLFIDDDCRLLGGGSALTDGVKTWARQQGIMRIDVIVDCRNALGVNYWQKQGFVETHRRLQVTLYDHSTYQRFDRTEVRDLRALEESGRRLHPSPGATAGGPDACKD